MKRGMMGVRVSLLAVLFSLILATRIEAQSADPGGVGWMAIAGPTRLSVDVEDPRRGLGVAGGAAILHSGAAALASLAHWPRIGNWRVSALHLEVRYPFSRGPKLGLYMATAFGYTWTSYRGPKLPWYVIDDPDGESSAFGLGVEFAPQSRLGVEFEVRLRNDSGGWNAETRLLAALRGTPSAVKAGAGGDVSVHTVWMIPIGGPWDPVEPGYSIRLERPLAGGVDVGASIAVLHWQIPRPGFFADYLVDTRAFVAYPAASFRPATGFPVWLRVGPTIIAMGEGPDAGTNIGAQAELAPRFRLFGVGVEGTLGWLWMPRGDVNNPGDQHGLMVGIGLRF